MGRDAILTCYVHDLVLFKVSAHFRYLWTGIIWIIEKSVVIHSNYEINVKVPFYMTIMYETLAT